MTDKLRCLFCTEVRYGFAALQFHLDTEHPNRPRLRAVPDTHADMDSRLAEAGREIRALKDMADSVVRRLEALDVAAVNHERIRRETLKQVSDRLLVAGNFSGVSIVDALL